MAPHPQLAARRQPIEADRTLVAPEKDLASAVREGLLGPGLKKLPASLLYDDLGSALFEAITHLPEYGLTRADERVLRTHASEIVRSLPPPLLVAELGSGTGRKTRWILEALRSRASMTYFPIDLSSAALARCRAELASPGRVTVEPIEADYRTGLSLVTSRRRARERLLVLFLGSTIGNFDRDEAASFLDDVRAQLTPGDGLLIGTDLVKPAEELLRAYDDPLGVTASFNLNLLVRLNRELGADFDLTRFCHEARWNEKERRVEMHLRSLAAQTVTVGELGVCIPFRKGERIWTESSYKYHPEEPVILGRRAGFACAGQWIDREWPFAETLLVPVLQA
jgi:L-histidine Nalpha-methyltransferase